MADIKTYTDQIANAVYGEEVRSSIINALNKVNDDNNSYTQIKSDVVAAKNDVTAQVNAFAAEVEEVSELREDLAECEKGLGIYKPINESGTSTTREDLKIVEGIEVVSHRTYTLTAHIEEPTDVPIYVSFWCESIKSESYLMVITIPSGSTTGSVTSKLIGNANDGYIAIKTDGRTVNWSVTFEDDAEHENKVSIIEKNIETNTEKISAVDEEVIDARTGYDGTAYNTLGTAIRTQVNDIKEDLSKSTTEISDILNIYKPIEKSGTSTTREDLKIVEGIEVVSHRTYTLTAHIEEPTDVAIYVAFWCKSIKSESYLMIITIPSGSTTGSVTSKLIGNANDGYITIKTGGRTVNWSVTFEDDAEHENKVSIIEKNIETNTEKISAVDEKVDNNISTKGRRYEKTTLDITRDVSFSDGAINLDGSLNPITSYRHTSKIKVSKGDVIETKKNLPYRLVTAYVNGVANANLGKESVSYYTVPDTVTEVVLTFYVGQSETSDTIIVTSTKMVDYDTTPQSYAIRKPRVTFIDDDGNVEFYTFLLPIMKKYNIPMVSAYMGDSNPDMHSNTALMTKEQCKEVVDNGGEIIVHYNPNLCDLTLDEAERTLLKSKEVLKENGFDSELVAYSTGNSNPQIRAMVSKYFKGGFTGSYPRVSNTDRSNHDCIPNYFIHREHCGGLYYDTSVEARSIKYFKDMIDECISNNGWLVFTLHSWLMPSGKTKPEYGDTDQLKLLEDIVQYIKSKEESTGIKVVTATDGFKMFGNIMQSGDYMGYWNEMILTPGESAMMGGHDDAGCAINKVGQYDFPTSKKINH